MRRTFCIDVDAEELDDLQIHDLQRRIADAVSYLGYVSFVDVVETTNPEIEECNDCWGV